jgi:hypothetical protein
MLAVQVVAGDLVVQFGVPVDLDRAGDVPTVVQQHVLVALDNDKTGRTQMFGQPVGADEPLGMGVFRELRVVVMGQCHREDLLVHDFCADRESRKP